MEFHYFLSVCGDLKKDANKQENGTSDPPINGALPEGDVSRSNTSELPVP